MQLRCLAWVCVWRWVREAPGPRGQRGNPSVTGLHRLQVSRLLPHRSPGPRPLWAFQPSGLLSRPGQCVAVPSDGFSVRLGSGISGAPPSPHPRPGQHCGEGPWICVKVLAAGHWPHKLHSRAPALLMNHINCCNFCSAQHK